MKEIDPYLIVRMERLLGSGTFETATWLVDDVFDVVHEHVVDEH